MLRGQLTPIFTQILYNLELTYTFLLYLIPDNRHSRRGVISVIIFTLSLPTFLSWTFLKVIRVFLRPHGLSDGEFPVPDLAIHQSLISGLFHS